MHTKTRRFIYFFIILVALLLLNTGLTLAKDNPFNLLAPQAQVGKDISTAISTGFTYQGQLVYGGEPAEGHFDLQFELYDAETDGSLISIVVLEDVAVTGGLFTVSLDFGTGAFNGQTRWLSIRVRPGSETGVYTSLTPRQPLTAAPYAQYALEAGTVAWGDVSQNPLPGSCTEGQFMAWNNELEVWECVDNSGTSYSAGFGLGLEGTELRVMTDTVQVRVMEDCAVGSTIRAIHADGTVSCEAHNPRPVFSRTLIDGGGNDSSITIGVDGLPVISFPDSAHKLKVAHCSDVACTSTTSTIVDTGDDIDIELTSIAIGADGLPIISYIDRTIGVLKVAHCENIACTQATLTALDTENDAGYFSSITIGVDGLPVISYYDYTNTDLKVAHCDDLVCNSVTITPIDTVGDVGWWTSIAIGADGLPVISYMDWSNADLKVAHCNDLVCSNASLTIINDPIELVGQYSSMTIGSDGLPVISYCDETTNNNDLAIAHCDDIACNSATINTLDTDGYTGNWTSITIGTDGLPVISYEGPLDDLKVAHCNDIACTNASTVSIDIGGYTTAITIGIDGLPLISHYQIGLGIKVVHCSNPFCIPYWQRR